MSRADGKGRGFGKYQKLGMKRSIGVIDEGPQTIVKAYKLGTRCIIHAITTSYFIFKTLSLSPEAKLFRNLSLISETERRVRNASIWWKIEFPECVYIISLTQEFLEAVHGEVLNSQV
ncbi:unnamed protein product [Clonostachys chloroleuca]|uniref:Uncharacterized protein n=1 Tax=Clonostachys chloroleuca TaxID=1926264 RepID=A0AA35MEK0_9HYPO|nr:unnamed protein product [Clonostachys chloroleuca]